MKKKSIKLYNTKAPNGYNLTDGGEGKSGYKMSDETRIKIGIIHKGKKCEKFTDEHKKKIGESKFKDYKIIYPNGRIEIIHGLKQWCNEMKFNYKSVHRSFRRGTLYKGYLIGNYKMDEE